MINRNSAPEIKQVDKINLIQAQKTVFANGIRAYSINAGTQDLVKIEWIFDAGSKFESMPQVAHATNSLLKEGTASFTSAEIAEQLDYYGAFLETNCTKDKAHIILYSLNKHLANVLPLLQEILQHAKFPEKEFAVYKQNSKQKLVVNNQKVEVLARHHFNELIFGKQHPYGVITELEHFDKLNLESIKQFYHHYYTPSNCSMVVSGLVKDETLQMLNQLFGDGWKSEHPVTKTQVEFTTTNQRTHLIEKADAVQSAIRIGRVLFNRTHPDYFGMQVLNTVLGGYFGSRLMNNIREDKGYTYGIGSAVASLQQGGYFFIATEVGVDVCAAAIQEIYFELKKLREELIPVEELDLVKNYLLGTFVRSVDGAFAMSEKFNSILEYGLGYDYFDAYLHTIRTISPERLQHLAITYLQEKYMIELVVGKK
ncbi:MAG TPA: pitrilysin family protein [Bacteroidia bacterium]|nr:pitrilysin family protein [Bacteroidia bacterium]HRH08337.1 pitrilysin family protein [Bacteroidia bacterium]